MSYMDKMCHECLHWDETLLKENGDPETQYGNCRRYPPLPFRSTEECNHDYSKVHRFCTFPITMVDDQACGEFKEKQ